MNPAFTLPMICAKPVPVVVFAMGVLLLDGEAPEISMLAGGALVVAGIYLFNRLLPDRRSVAPTVV